MNFYAFLFIFLTSIMLISCTPTYINEADRVTNLIAKDATQHHGLIVWGTGGSLMENVEVIDVLFQMYEDLTLPQARKLLVDVMERSLLIVNTDLKIRPYLNNFPFTYKNIAITITFFKEKYGQYVSSEYISRVGIRNGKISYSSANNKPSMFDSVHQETYEEALEIVRNSN